jgi:3-deoxy-manno-octulosonate cytidylyltransferase (CMP-KDO synthetase)
MKIAAVIPAHLASIRFPGKILHPIHGLPMIEHVRRRALRGRGITDVYVATCDDEIAREVKRHGGRVIRTSDRHTNGTSRVAEAIASIDCTHVILLQGDEPLLIPDHIERMISAMHAGRGAAAWNVTGPIEDASELDRHSFVKCVIGPNDRIVFCFRRSPCFSDYEIQRSFTRKILGIIGYTKEFLARVVRLPASHIESAESIEQMRIVENGFFLASVPVPESLPSVNEPHEVKYVLDCLEQDQRQKSLLNEIRPSPVVGAQ